MEQQYIDLVKEVITSGEKREDRTGEGTVSLFGKRMEFDISERFPLFTHKKMPFKMILKELLWFLSGSTDANILKKQKVPIWDGNSSREFLDKRGLNHLPEGDIGAGYGHQWRHFGAPYTSCKEDKSGTGVDQIEKMVDLIKNDPTSRRIILCAWNPAQQHQMALPACHLLFQCYVREGKYLDGQLYQRSGDLGLGIPFNVASYACLLYMLAFVTDLKPGKFVHVIGDCHVYNSHIDPLSKYFEDVTLNEFPILKIKRQVKNIFDFKVDDFEIEGYKSGGCIKMKMAI